MFKKRAKAVFEQLDLAIGRFGDHHLTDWAAALTYYSVLSIFPGLLALVSILGLVGFGTTDAIIDTFNDLPEGPAREILLSAVKNVQGEAGAATTALFLGLMVAIYSASSYIGAFIRASGVILGVEETRRFFVTIPLRLGLTLLLMVLAVMTAFAIVMTGPIAEQFTNATGFDGDSIGGWGTVKWPIVLLLFLTALGILYSLGPNFEKTRFRFATSGTLLALVLWLIASALFSYWVDNFGQFNKVFGSLASVAIFFIWLYLSNVAVLLGLEFDNELRRYKKAHGYGAFSRQRFRNDEQDQVPGR
ncbi:MAG: YihY/virulence factor BrkB family protein [Thermoleophilaceae bacterium]|nr:YihY/virulence factor BrkB family protein [Thermoleophilaceae bacterium]